MAIKTYNQWVAELPEQVQANAPESILQKQYRDTYLSKFNVPQPAFSQLGSFDPNTAATTAVTPAPSTTPKVAQIAHTGTYDPTTGKVVQKAPTTAAVTPTPTTTSTAPVSTVTPAPTQVATQAAPTPAPAAPQYDILGEINKAADARKASRSAALKGLLDKTNTALQAERATIAPQYYGLKNDESTKAQLRAKRIGEIMAQKGYSEGYAGNAEVGNNVTYRGELGNLDRQEQGAYNDIARRGTDAQTEYNAGLAQAAADAETWQAEQRLNELGTLRDYSRDDARYADTRSDVAYNRKYQEGRDTVNDTGYTRDASGNLIPTMQRSQMDIDNAWNRASQLGYVDKGAAVILGVPEGTPTLQAKQMELDNQYRQDTFDWQKQNDVWSQKFQEGQFDYQKERDAVSDKEWNLDYNLQLDQFAWSKSANNPTVKAQILSNYAQDLQNQMAKIQLQYLPQEEQLKIQQMQSELKAATATPAKTPYESDIQYAKFLQIQAETAKIEADTAKISSSLSPNYKAAQTQASKLKTQGKSDADVADYIMSAGLSDAEEMYLINSLKLKL